MLLSHIQIYVFPRMRFHKELFYGFKDQFLCIFLSIFPSFFFKKKKNNWFLSQKVNINWNVDLCVVCVCVCGGGCRIETLKGKENVRGVEQENRDERRIPFRGGKSKDWEECRVGGCWQLKAHQEQKHLKDSPLANPWKVFPKSPMGESSFVVLNTYRMRLSETDSGTHRTPLTALGGIQEKDHLNFTQRSFGAQCCIVNTNAQETVDGGKRFCGL